MINLRRLITSDIPFARDDAQRMLPAMIACLVGFATLLLAMALSLNHALDSQASAVAGVLQIEVPPEVPPATLDRVLAQVRAADGVQEVRVLNRTEMEALLKPWLGNDFALGSLPVPSLIDATTRMTAKGTAVDVAGLRQALQHLDGGIRVAENNPWVGQLASALNLLQWLVVLVAGLLLLCVIGMVVLVARTHLKLHFKTVGLLHRFGATDAYILRQFQWNGAGLAARGATAGVAMAAGMFGVAAWLSIAMHSPVIPVIHVGLPHVAAFVLLPLLTSAVALVATRLTVRAMLHHLH